jgi:hypothetical protein
VKYAASCGDFFDDVDGRDVLPAFVAQLLVEVFKPCEALAVFRVGVYQLSERFLIPSEQPPFEVFLNQAPEAAPVVSGYAK